MSDDRSLRAALQQARDAFLYVSDGIVFTDRDDVIVFANPAAARLTGATVGSLDGTSGHSLLTAAEERDVTVHTMPRIGGDGTTDGWLAILRPAAEAPGDEAAVTFDAGATAEVVDLVAGLQLGAGLDETIERLCQAIALLPGIDGAMILLLPPSGDLIHKAHAGRARVPYRRDQRLPLQDVESLIDLTLAGPWAVSTSSAAAWRMFGPFALAMRASGVRATAYAGLRVGGRLLGVLSVASMARNGLEVLQARQDVLAQLATIAATALHHQTNEFGRQDAMRRRIRAELDGQRFSPVFQPIVHLRDGALIGFESLTRFDDGLAPDVHFEEASLSGLGRELEEAAARLALQEAEQLPEGLLLALNFSPEVFIRVAGERWLAESARPLTIEVTEHAQVQDYRGLNDALARAPHLQLSVDDAGAGFASLRHILELRPAFVKLDITLVRDVHRDPARAALVAGMVHFARSTGAALIAEGVENAEEADALRELGVEYAQGYHFGRPAPAATFVTD